MNEEENINDWIDIKLDIIQVLISQVDSLKNPVLKSEYLIEHHKITFFLILLIKPENMSWMKYQDFKKRTF